MYLLGDCGSEGEVVAGHGLKVRVSEGSKCECSCEITYVRWPCAVGETGLLDLGEPEGSRGQGGAVTVARSDVVDLKDKNSQQKISKQRIESRIMTLYPNISKSHGGARTTGPLWLSLGQVFQGSWMVEPAATSA